MGLRVRYDNDSLPATYKGKFGKHKMGKCLNCGISIESKYPFQKFCKVQCRWDYWNIKRYKPMKPCICLYCGVYFESKRHRDYCSSPCKWRNRYYLNERDNVGVRLSRAMAHRIRFSLAGGKGRKQWENLVGFGLDSLRKHLESHFKDGMTWENYGSWHIDHKIPITAFNYQGPGDIDFKRCWSLKNLQPMWAVENIRKGNHMDIPFQPSLSISA